MNSSCSLDYRKGAAFRVKRLIPAILFGALLVTVLSASAQTLTLHIAAASDLQPVLPSLAAAYEAKSGIHIVSSFGSSATLTQQLINGDPQDVFLSADRTHPEQLIAAGLASGLRGGKTPVQYATGVLVLWARKDSPAQPLSLASLTRPAVTRIAIANPLHAPYGLAATRALEALQLTQAVAAKLVVAENISQTAQFAESGNAQLGLISLTIARSAHYRGLGSYVRFPEGSYPALQQCGVVLKSSRNQAAANAFLEWLTSAATQAMLPDFGLEPAK